MKLYDCLEIQKEKGIMTMGEAVREIVPDMYNIFHGNTKLSVKEQKKDRDKIIATELKELQNDLEEVLSDTDFNNGSDIDLVMDYLSLCEIGVLA